MNESWLAMFFGRVAPRWTGFAIVAVAILSGGRARAQISRESQAAAQAIFDEARKLMADGKYAEACPKFAESQRLDPGAGTLLNLANCYEKNGQTASAWATFIDAGGEAKKSAHDDWEATAHKRADLLEPTLSRLTISVPEAAWLDGFEIRRDGAVVPRAEWGSSLPVDPGRHVIVATAPRRRKWARTFILAPKGGTEVLTIPTLDVDETVVRRRVAVAFGGVAVASLVVGSVFGLEAKAKNDQALLPSHCPSPTSCYPSGIDLANEARTFATVSTIGFVVGAATLVGGGVLYFWPAKRREGSKAAALSLTPSVGRGGVGLTLGGDF